MILAAGLGTRMRPLTYLLPKPMAPVLDAPVMEHAVRLLKNHGFEQVITNLSYLPEQIREHFGDGSEFGIELTYSEESEPLGTAGGVGKVRDFLAAEDSFLVISGDALTDIDLGAMRKAHEATPRTAVSPPWRPSGSTTRRSSASRSPARTGASRASRRSRNRPRRSRTWPTAASTCSAPRSSTTSPSPGTEPGRRRRPARRFR